MREISEKMKNRGAWGWNSRHRQERINRAKGGGVAERFGEGGSVGEEEQREGDRSAKTLSPLSNI